MTSKNIMIVGVGSQGALLTSRILGKLAIGAGFDMKLLEVHGMAQRGGSMITFVRYGEKVAGPIVKEGQVDVLVVFERLEALRYLHFLKKDGVVTVNDRRIDPITVMTGVAQYPEGIIDRLREARRTIVVEATEEVKKMGAPKVSNVVVLRAAVEHTGFEKEDWLKVVETTVPPKTVKTNKKAFETGYALFVQMDRSRSNRGQSDRSREVNRRADCKQIRDIKVCHVRVGGATGR